MSDHTNEETGVTQSESENSRREFLKKAGKFAVYTPPAVMLLMKPSYATICKSYTGRPQQRDFRKSFKPDLKKSNFKQSYKPKFSQFKNFR